MPMPPPPAAALSITGNPTWAATARASSALPTGPSEPGSTGTPAAAIRRRASVFSPMVADDFGRRPDEHQARLPARLGEAPVLGQEAVTRMHRLGAAGPGGLHETVDRQVALDGGRRAQVHGPVGGPDVGRVRVGVRVHGHRPDPEAPAGADDPERDLAPVRDQHRVEHYPSSPAATRVSSVSWIRHVPSAPRDPSLLDDQRGRPDVACLEDVMGADPRVGHQLEAAEGPGEEPVVEVAGLDGGTRHQRRPDDGVPGHHPGCVGFGGGGRLHHPRVPVTPPASASNEPSSPSHFRTRACRSSPSAIVASSRSPSPMWPRSSARQRSRMRRVGGS